jgi:energy-coupling factor transport system substrate-specific component
MEALPNIHLLGTLTVAYTLTYRTQALIPIYTYIFLNGLYAGFNLWWVPYLYIWALLWGMAMLVPRRLPQGVLAVLLPLVSALHGLAYGALYAPAQALMFGLDFNGMLAWIAAGIPFDLMHAFGNLLLGFLILPLYKLLYFLTYRKKI